MKFLRSSIFLITCTGLVACSNVKNWDCVGHYHGNGMYLWLKPDSTATLNVQYCPDGYSDKGKWQDVGRNVIVTFPKDTSTSIDISHILIYTFEMDTIIFEKKKPKCINWKNRGSLIKEN